MDRGAWQAIVHGVAKSQTWLKQLSTQFCNLWNKHIHWVFPKTCSAVLCYISIDPHAAGLGREWKRRKKRWCSWHFYWPFPHSLPHLWVKVPRWVGWALQAFWLFYTSERALWSSGNKPASRESHVFTLRSRLCHRWHPRTPNICDKQLLGISVHVGCGFCLPQSLGVPTYIWGSLVPQIVKICLQCRRTELDPWVRNIPWRSEWLPAPVFCLENSMDKRVWWATGCSP